MLKWTWKFFGFVFGERELKMAKKKYEVVFNWEGEIHTIWTSAFHPQDAFLKACLKLAKKLNRTGYSVRNYFYNSNRYEIKEQGRIN